ncbi:MAG: amino acid ABC transporter permease [Clostridia bacterium]|nr:amino acid ABC transporter permease [Clostridia bacterium]
MVLGILTAARGGTGFLDVTLKLLEGFEVTLLLFALTLVFALPLGLVIAFGSMSRFKPLKYVTRTFVWIIRGVPLMLQLFLVFYVPGMLFDLQWPTELFGMPINSRFLAALVAFVINYACYFSEIYRGGIESISRGQYEAGQVLGMSKSQIFFKVVLLQVVKRIVPPMSNEVITLVKDTALARVIIVVEIIMAAEELMSRSLIWPLFYTGVFYLLFVGILTILFGWIEKKLDYFKA